MRKIVMPYGRGNMEFSIPEENVTEFIESKEGLKIHSETDVVLNALNNPIESKKLREIVKEGERVCIIISDITRQWQRMNVYLPLIVEEIKMGGVRDEDIIFLCATGSHRKQSDEEHRLLLGNELYEKYTIVDHDCTDMSNMDFLGTTSYGTPVYVNKIAMECDHIVLTGAIVFHDMAGFGGGRKSILPGISSYETIMANHSLSLNSEVGGGSNPNTRSGKTSNNPMHLDMNEAANMAKPSFLFNVIIGENGAISSAVAGHCIEAHNKGCSIVEQKDGVHIEEKADMVIASAGGYPKDINLYQGSKALTNAKEAVKEGGTIILLCQCEEGMGNDEVRNIIAEFKTNYEREMEIRKNYTIAKFTGYLIAEIAEKYKVILVTGMDKKIFNGTGIQVFKHIDEALNKVYREKGKNIKTYVMPSGGCTLPICV